MKKEERVLELLQDDSFLEKVDTADGVEGLKKLFKENGVDMSSDEVKELVEFVASTSKTGEISEEELDNVSGGSWIGTLQKMWKAAKWGWRAGVKFSDWMYKNFGIR